MIAFKIRLIGVVVVREIALRIIGAQVDKLMTIILRRSAQDTVMLDDSMSFSFFHVLSLKTERTEDTLNLIFISHITYQ